MAQNKRTNPGEVLGRRTISKIRRYFVWDCSSCGTRGLNSKKCKQCPQCGNSKDVSDREERSADIVDANYKHEGADVTCQFCKTENIARFSCIECGAALDKKFAKLVSKFTVGPTDLPTPTRVVQIDDKGFLPDATDTPWMAGASTNEVEPVVLKEPALFTPHQRGADEPSPEAEASTKQKSPSTLGPRTESTPDKHGRTVLIVAVTVVMVVILFGMYMFNKMNTFTQTLATVESVSWTYSLPREDYAARSRSNETENYFWRPPSEVFDVRSNPTIIRYEPIYDQVWVEETCTRTETSSYNDTDGTWVTQTDLVSYDCSGYEQRQIGTEPIEGTRWTWKVMAWEITTPLSANGNSYQVEYPTFTPTSTLRQAGEPDTAFTITFTYMDNNGDAQTAVRNYPQATWERTAIGKSYDAVADGFDRLRAVSGLDPDYKQLLE